MSFQDIIGPSSGTISTGQEVVRAAIIFFYGLILFRLAGRRTFARWSTVDTVVAVVTGSALSRTLTGNAPLLGTLAATALLVFLHWLITHGAARSALVSRLVEGSPIELGGEDGVDPERLRRHGISDVDFAEAVRGAGIAHPLHAKRFTLEPSGKITVVK